MTITCGSCFIVVCWPFTYDGIVGTVLKSMVRSRISGPIELQQCGTVRSSGHWFWPLVGLEAIREGQSQASCRAGKLAIQSEIHAFFFCWTRSSWPVKLPGCEWRATIGPCRAACGGRAVFRPGPAMRH